MVVLHSRNDILVRTRDGLNFVLQEPLEVVRDDGARFRVPADSTTDGASTPNELWPVLPPFGDYWLAAVIHDSAYRGTLERQLESGEWTKALLNKEQSDDLFMDVMSALGVAQRTKETLYEGVHLLGYKAFRGDRTGQAA